MPNINKPMDVPELNLQPPITGKIRLSEDMQQTLAVLSAMGVNQRVMLRASESGILNVAEPRIKDIVHYERLDPRNDTQGDNVPCTECLIMGHPDNIGKVWVRPDATATADNAWPLAAWDCVKMSLDNLQQLKMYIVENGDGLIVAYTR